jgi:hypothetical protein
MHLLHASAAPISCTRLRGRSPNCFFGTCPEVSTSLCSLLRRKMHRSNCSYSRSNSEVRVVLYSYPLRPCADLFERFPTDAALATSTSSAAIHFARSQGHPHSIFRSIAFRKTLGLELDHLRLSRHRARALSTLGNKLLLIYSTGSAARGRIAWFACVVVSFSGSLYFCSYLFSLQPRFSVFQMCCGYLDPPPPPPSFLLPFRLSCPSWV